MWNRMYMNFVTLENWRVLHWKENWTITKYEFSFGESPSPFVVWVWSCDRVLKPIWSWHLTKPKIKGEVRYALCVKPPMTATTSQNHCAHIVVSRTWRNSNHCELVTILLVILLPLPLAVVAKSIDATNTQHLDLPDDPTLRAPRSTAAALGHTQHLWWSYPQVHWHRCRVYHFRL
jgi:hypothetical protein